MSWTQIESQTLGSSQASVTLGSGGTIPQTFKTLKLVMSARSDRAAVPDGLKISFNGSTSSFTYREISGNGATASSTNAATGWSGNIDAASATASTFGNLEITIPNYAGSTNKPFSTDAVMENNATTAYQNFVASLWSNTAAITSVGITSDNSANFVSGSTFTLYGLK